MPLCALSKKTKENINMQRDSISNKTHKRLLCSQRLFFFLRLSLPRSLSTDMWHFINCIAVTTGMWDSCRQHEVTHAILSSMLVHNPSLVDGNIPPCQPGRTWPYPPAAVRHPCCRRLSPCPTSLWQALLEYHREVCRDKATGEVHPPLKARKKHYTSKREWKSDSKTLGFPACSRGCASGATSICVQPENRLIKYFKKCTG